MSDKRREEWPETIERFPEISSNFREARDIPEKTV